MRVAIHQPNYAPWCGYFTKLRMADVFVLLDDAQMPGGQSYVSRTRIWNAGQVRWLSVPTTYKLGEQIHDVHCAGGEWTTKHFTTLRCAYSKSRYGKEILALLAPLYAEPSTSLAEFNIRLIQTICSYLGLETRMVRSSELSVSGLSDDRLIAITKTLGGTTYLSGKGGANYQDPRKFAEASIALDVREYHPLPYEHISGIQQPGLSILDALFHMGRNAVSHLNY